MKTLDHILRQLQELFNSNDYDAAENLLLTARESPSLSLHAQGRASHLLGRMFFYDRDFIRASRYLKEALAKNPADRYSKIYLARIAERTGDRITSLHLYEECLSDAPPFSHIAPLIRRLRSGKDVPVSRRPAFSVLVLCHNQSDYTLRCLEAVLASADHADFEVVVVDNGSVDDTPGMLEAYGDHIKLIHSRTNVGVVAGYNLAAQKAVGDYLVFLHNDMEVQRGWLNEIADRFGEHPDAGAVGSTLVHPQGFTQEFFESEIASSRDGCRKGAPVTNEAEYCFGVSLAVKANLFRQLGGFDVRFSPAFYEDVDLCYGIRKLGYKILHCPTSKILHHGGATTGMYQQQAFSLFRSINRSKLVQKWANDSARGFVAPFELPLAGIYTGATLNFPES